MRARRLPFTESRMLAWRSRRTLRSSGELPSPNMRSNNVCGLISIGNGRVGDCQEMVLVYTQLYPSPQLELAPGSSTASCNEGKRLPPPIFAAMTWSIEVPTSMSGPVVLRGFIPVRNAAATK